ncbi:hypothetical protein BC940DRAFT_126601 [Gongronella butleri]|nr:hypothetical protein BC940DRAFT_126601 [Gongronella butleri]
MYVIVTDMGQLVPIDPESVHTMPELQEHLASMTRTPLEDQILLLPTGVQLKAQHLNDEDTCILFNRQLLETKDSYLVIADHALPTLTALPAALSPTLPQDETLWPARCLETYELLHPIVADDKQVAAEVMDDLNALHVAWKAAIANLDHHIKTTYDVQDQFDRMAQRELSKADHTLQSMERDWMLFMQRWPVHPAMASQKHPCPQSKTSSVASLSPTPSPTSHQIIESAPLPLTTALDLQPLQQQRAQLAQQLQKLDNKRKKLLGRLDHIRQQATQLHMREANANAKTAATTNTTLQQIDRHGALFQSIHARLTHPKTRALSPSHADTVDLSQSELIAALEDQWRAETSKNDSDAAASPATATLTYAQYFQGLLLCQSVVRQSVDAMIEVKRSTMRQLFRSLRVISTLQEAIANLFATLRHVSQEVKKLGQKLDDLHAVTIDILQGYGMALIELWRRSQYDSCIMNNAKRLADWYTQTAAAEQSYRRRFLASVAIIDQLDTVFAPNAKFGVCIIPFACKDLHKLTPSTKMHLSVTSDRKSVEHAIEKEDIHDYIEALKEHYQQENRELVDQLFDAWTQASQYIQQSFLTPGPHALDKVK